ncbi:MAG: hypothetical protein ACAH11_01690 [Sphingomonas sp.]
MIASLILAAGLAAHPAPMFAGKCEVSKLWGTVVPTIPMEQQRHVVFAQGKQFYWNSRLMTIERAVAEIGPEMADGNDILVIDASVGKCAQVKELAAALEGPAACTPERCFVSSTPVPPRKPPEEPKP